MDRGCVPGGGTRDGISAVVRKTSVTAVALGAQVEFDAIELDLVAVSVEHVEGKYVRVHSIDDRHAFER